MPTPHILLVEDNPGDVLLFRKALRREGLTLPLEIAADGVEALERLSRADIDAPDLLLLDLNMPRLSGIEVLRQIRQDPGRDALRIVILSSSSAEYDLGAARTHRADGYVLKPSSIQDLQALVRALAQDWPDLTALPSIL